MVKKKLILMGATGLVGKILFKKLKEKGYEIYIISRHTEKAKKLITGAYEYIDSSNKNRIEKIIDGCYGIINLSGAPIVGKRWSAQYKKTIQQSRLETTKQISTAIQNAKQKPHVLINASAIGYYGTDTQKICYEEDKPGNDFLGQVCVAWEKEAKMAIAYNVRVVLVRTSIVLDKFEGALPQMLRPFHFFIGGPIGKGTQWFSWIHGEDEVGIILFALENKNVEGPINAAAPEVVNNRKFSTIAGEMLKRPSFIPVPIFIIKLFFGEAASVITSGVNASSQKISQLGFIFKYPTLRQALAQILSK